jgi:hypothetical protein
MHKPNYADYEIQVIYIHCYPYLPTYSIRHDLNCENSCNHNVKDKDDDKHHILRKRHQYKLLHFVQQQFSVSNHQSGNYPRFRNKDAR